MTRVPPLRPEDLSEEQRAVYDAIRAGPRGTVRGPLEVWLQSPGLAGHAQALGAHCRYGSSLPPRLSELAIAITAAHWRSGYEWHVHAPIARGAGLTDAVLEAIRKGEPPMFDKDDESAVYRFAIELLTTREVADATFERARALLGMRALVDLVGILGYYGLISMTINAFEVAVPPDAVDPFVT